MYTAVSVLIIIICALLILIVLVQNSKGGGLASSFASSNQIMGVRKTTDFLEKATWTLAGAMLVLCVVASIVMPRGEEVNRSAIEQQVNEAQAPVNAIPTFPGVTDGSGDAAAPQTSAPAEEGAASSTEE